MKIDTMPVTIYAFSHLIPIKFGEVEGLFIPFHG